MVIGCPHCGRKHRSNWCAQKRRTPELPEIVLEFSDDEFDGDYQSDNPALDRTPNSRRKK